MKALLIFGSLLPALAGAGGLLSAGDTGACAWDGRDGTPAVCWGNRNDKRTGETLPILNNAIAMGSGAWHTCALHEGQDTRPRIDCWGYGGFGLKNVPVMDGYPRLLSVGRWHNCAVYEEENRETEIACWGQNSDGEAQVPSARLSNPTSVFAGRYLAKQGERTVGYTCARHAAGKILCWGGIEGEFLAEMFPRVTGSANLQCERLADGTPDCWTNSTGGEFPVERIVKENQTCELTAGAVKCRPLVGPEYTIEGLSNPSTIAVGARFACALHDFGVKCGGMDNSNGQQDAPNEKLLFGPMLTRFEQVPQFLETLTEFVYAYDEKMLHELKALIPGEGDSAITAFVINALRPYLTDSGYRRTKERYLNSALRNIDRLNREYGYAIEGESTADVLRSIAKTLPDSQTLASRILVVVLQTTKPVLGIQERKDLETVIAKLGHDLSAGSRLDSTTTAELLLWLENKAADPYLSGRVIMAQILLSLVH